MPINLEDIPKRLNNPVYGAFLIWRFTKLYQGRSGSDTAPIPLLFLVLPISLSTACNVRAKSTYWVSGLRKFVHKFDDSRDELYLIHRSALDIRELSLTSLATASKFGWLNVNYNTAGVSATGPKKIVVPDDLKLSVSTAEKFGYWSAEHSVTDVARMLEVWL